MANKVLHLLWNAALLGAFFIQGAFLSAITRDPDKLRRRRVAGMNRFARLFRRALNLRVTVHGRDILDSLRAEKYLLVANHVSYLDVIVVGSLERLVFITSVEMGADRIMGPVTRNGGCLFTDRRKFVSLPKEIERFSQCLADGSKVVLFPEGTSTNGDAVQAFRGSLFQIAISAQAPVLPMCVRYLKLDGKPVSTANRDTICWYGDMTFMPHFWKLMGHKIEVEVTILPPVPFEPRRSRAELSGLIHQQISQVYQSYPPFAESDPDTADNLLSPKE